MLRHPTHHFTRHHAVSSVYGKIDQILLSFPGEQDQVEAKMVIRRYKALFRAFGDRVTFFILGNFGDQCAVIQQELAKEGLHPVLIPTPYTARQGQGNRQGEFIADPFVVLTSPAGDTLLLEQYWDNAHRNAYLAEQTAEALGLPIRPTRFAVEGGNILIGDDYALIGRNLLARNINIHFAHSALEPEALEQHIRAEFCKMLGVRWVYFIGDDQVIPEAREWYPEAPEALQPFFHIDLYLTLAGRNQAGDEVVLLARISTPRGITPEQERVIDMLNGRLNEVREQLEEISKSDFGPKFDVVEIPMGGEFTLQDGKPRFIPYSYNNALVESWQGIRRIYLPKYDGFDRLEIQLAEDLTGIKFGRISRITHGFEDYARQNGSLHCLTKVLRRIHHPIP